jgi:DNA-binding CsgD family transcriptional regulator
MRNIGHSSEAVAKQTLGHIDRVRLTTRDIDNALDINGKSVSFLRGKSTRKRPLAAREAVAKQTLGHIDRVRLTTRDNTSCG